MKKLLAVILCGLFLLSCCAYAQEDGTVIHVASLKGPTTMGMVKLIHDNESGESLNEYDFAIEGAADAIAPALLKQGALDIALVPCNVASVWYNNSNGAVQVAAINTLGVLYVLEAGDTIQSVEDLKGKTIYSTGQGATPEYALNYVLKGNGLDPETDVNVEFLTEATEVANAMLNDKATVAVLPQPYVTGVLAQNSDVRVALSLSDEWDKIDETSAMITGVVLVRKEFAEENPEAVAAFLEEYRASTEYVNENPAEAAVWIAELEIVAKAPIAEKAIPACNIVCITGEEMQEKIGGYLTALYEQNPAAVGGTLPDEAFYYIAKADEAEAAE